MSQRPAPDRHAGDPRADAGGPLAGDEGLDGLPHTGAGDGRLAVPPGGGPAQRARLVLRFHMSMLVIVAIDTCFAVIYAIPLQRFWPTAVALTAFMLVGGHLIFRRIGRFLRDPQRTRLPVRAVATLSLTCTVYTGIVVGALAVVKVTLLPAVLDIDIDALLSPRERLWIPIIHTLYYTLLVYFVMVDFEAALRARIYAWYDELIPATRGRLVNRLIAAFVVTSLLPIGLIVLHTLERDGITARADLLEDIAATMLGLAVCLVFVTRSLLRPVRELDAAMERLRENDLSAGVPVLGNDETGRLADGFNRMVRGLRERALIRETFGRYVPERVAAAILSNAGHIKPRSAVATILYVDLVGFTRIVEHSSPEQVVAMLNAFFSAAVEIIESNGGVVTQFQGDAMLITFNLPVADDVHADSALRAGIGIRRLCAERRFAGIELQTRIGVATGHVTAGSVGSDSRMSYTVHGDAVNLSARLEQMNKDLGTDLLVDEETVSRLHDAYPLQFVDEVAVRGRVQRVRVYGLRSDRDRGQETGNEPGGAR